MSEEALHAIARRSRSVSHSDSTLMQHLQLSFTIHPLQFGRSPTSPPNRDRPMAHGVRRSASRAVLNWDLKVQLMLARFDLRQLYADIPSACLVSPRTNITSSLILPLSPTVYRDIGRLSAAQVNPLRSPSLQLAALCKSSLRACSCACWQGAGATLGG